MKKLFFFSLFLGAFFLLNAQAPQGISYQAVVRDANGNVIANQQVQFRFTILQDAYNGQEVFQEVQNTTTNSLGIVNLTIGSGVPYIGNISEIDWGNHSHYLRVEIDPQANNNFTELGVTQLVSVPYALFANICGNAVTYNAGNGIDITNGVITNTAPDQIVTLNAGPGVSITGSYPNFTITSTATEYTAGNGIEINNGIITNTAPDQTVTINAGPGVSVSGSYPNFTVTNTSPDQTITLNAGNGINISGTYPNFTITSTATEYTAGNGIEINNGIITNTAPDQTVTINAGPGVSVSGSYPNFTVTNSAPDQTITLNAGNGINISGTYPDFTITSTATEYTAGNGISIENGVITNTSPDKEVNIISGEGISVSGVYPYFLIDHEGHTGDVSGITSLTVTGIQNKPVSANAPTLGQVLQYNGAIWAPVNSSSLITAGSGLSYSGSTLNSVWSINGNNIYNNNTGNVGIGILNPSAKLSITDTSNLIFQIKDKLGRPVFEVYQDSVKVYISSGPAKSNKGAFVINPKMDSGKQGEANYSYLTVTPDSTQVTTENPEGGFSVNDASSTISNYMNITPENYFIGHEAGKNNTTGKFNIFLGYNSGYTNTAGSYNVFLGNKTGFYSNASNYCTFLGFEAGRNNNSDDNTFIGYLAGYRHKTGGGNVFIGSKAGQKDTLGVRNIFIGELAGYNNYNGMDNIYIGTNSGYNNLNGIQNLFVGTESGYKNTSGEFNIFLGYQSGYRNSTGNCNVFIGKQSGYNNKTSHYNTYVGMSAGYSDSVGSYNTMVGCNAGFFIGNGASNTFIGCNAGWRFDAGSNNTFVGTDCGRGGAETTPPNTNPGNLNAAFGYGAAYYIEDANYNTIIGPLAGFRFVKGDRNIFIGYQAGYLHTNCSNLLYIENSTDTITPLVNGNFSTNRIAFNCRADTYPLQVGTNSSNGNGAYLTTGGVWTNASSKTLKDRFEKLNGTEILNKISNLDIKAWYYKGTQERHIGPVAEDFYNLFGTGVLDEPKYLGKSLAASDVAGVSLLAVKELINIINEQQNKIEKMQNEINELKSIINKNNKKEYITK